MNRRHFFHTVAGAASSITFSHLFMGCSQDTASMMPPSLVLGGDPTQPWWLRGNYAPITDEIESYDLEVQGAIPPELEGIFLRNGSNPTAGTSQHWFIGDGMLHGVRFSGGRALWYRNRWVRTYAYENRSGDNLASNRANTSVVHHAGKLLALYEAGVPHELSPSDLSTIGEYDFGGNLVGP